MSRIQTKAHLLKEISCLIDEYVSLCVHSKNEQQYNMVVKADTPTASQDATVVAPSPQKADTQCRAIMSSKKRCSKEISEEEGHDHELCKYHNNPRFAGKITKVEVEPASPASLASLEPNSSEGNVEEEANESDPEDLVTVYLTKDDDDDMVDQDGNIWDVNERIITGKKDLKTNEKVFFKNI
jgi:hypothetical protein